jgi:hypothetical protein
LMWINSEFVSNEIDENDLQLQKYDEQRIWTWRGVNMDVVHFLSDARESIRMMQCAAAARERELTGEWWCYVNPIWNPILCFQTLERCRHESPN